MIAVVQRIAELQQEYSSESTPAMQERGQLIRHEVPDLLRGHMTTFRQSIGRFSDDLSIQGSDGIGRKTEAPWVRLYSKSLSDSATRGFYVVIHFAVSGTAYFVTIGCGASKWDSKRGDLVPNSDKELHKKVQWALEVLHKAGKDLSYFSDEIQIGSATRLPRTFEKATILTKTLDPQKTTLAELVDALGRSLNLLSIIYEAFSQRADLTAGEASEIEIQNAVNPARSHFSQRQGYGLTAPERKAVEMRAMEITRSHLENLHYKVKDTSAKYPFDFLAEREGEAVKVEVKGTTSSEPDTILMTSNEVELHRSESGSTALAIVSGITLTKRGASPAASGGHLEFHFPWDIEAWQVTPKAYAVSRKL